VEEPPLVAGLVQGVPGQVVPHHWHLRAWRRRAAQRGYGALRDAVPPPNIGLLVAPGLPQAVAGRYGQPVLVGAREAAAAHAVDGTPAIPRPIVCLLVRPCQQLLQLPQQAHVVYGHEALRLGPTRGPHGLTEKASVRIAPVSAAPVPAMARRRVRVDRGRGRPRGRVAVAAAREKLAGGRPHLAVASDRQRAAARTQPQRQRQGVGLGPRGEAAEVRHALRLAAGVAPRALDEAAVGCLQASTQSLGEARLVEVAGALGVEVGEQLPQRLELRRLVG